MGLNKMILVLKEWPRCILIYYTSHRLQVYSQSRHKPVLYTWHAMQWKPPDKIKKRELTL